MKRLAVGILAHVDSGKTTLSEAMLYNAGELSKPGRVDHGDAFLDNNAIERDRGITVFSKQAVLKSGETEINLLDTPGHTDFSAEAERVLCVLDYAVLVVSSTDGVQSHTETLWRMLGEYGIPTFLFINKTDLPGMSKAEILLNLKEHFGEGCLAFEERSEAFFEEAAMLDVRLLEEYAETGTLSQLSLTNAIAERRLFPCFFGSALKNDGVSELLEALDVLTAEKKYPDEFSARVFKISEDAKHTRLTHMKITGGVLRTRALIEGENEKVNEIRIYSGEKYKAVQEIAAGGVCAVAGLSKTYAGEGLGGETDSTELTSEPVFSYTVIPPDGVDLHTLLTALKHIEEEENRLRVVKNDRYQCVEVRVMGKIQLEVLRRILSDRFGIDAEFEHGRIIYKETIKNSVEGVGHYEPLRHYAEVHLLLEPIERGSGLVFASRCSDEALERSFQRLVLTHLAEKRHIGVLTGSELTDVKITLVNGRAHKKHTEGGDFRQATYRAVRQGLMQAENVLLEPQYSFKIELPTEKTGKAMTDLQQLGAELSPPESLGSVTRIKGTAPVAAIRDYQSTLTAYTHGAGKISYTLSGYAECKNPEALIEEIGYACESDTENTADSIFCSHGSGSLVRWDKVFEHMHLPLQSSVRETAATASPQTASRRLIAGEEELLRIFEMTYGRVRRVTPTALKTPHEKPTYTAKPIEIKPEYLLIDGYNIIYAWEELKKIAEESLEDARDLLIRRVCNYRAMRQNNVLIVFDAYRVSGGERETESYSGVGVIYTKEAETADSYIEKASHELAKNYRVRVATSDSLVQMIIFGSGAVRTTARELAEEITAAEAEMRKMLAENNRNNC